jgi:hypothetical protein
VGFETVVAAVDHGSSCDGVEILENPAESTQTMPRFPFIDSPAPAPTATMLATTMPMPMPSTSTRVRTRTRTRARTCQRRDVRRNKPVWIVSPQHAPADKAASAKTTLDARALPVKTKDVYAALAVAVVIASSMTSAAS